MAPGAIRASFWAALALRRWAISEDFIATVISRRRKGRRAAPRPAPTKFQHGHRDRASRHGPAAGPEVGNRRPRIPPHRYRARYPTSIADTTRALPGTLGPRAAAQAAAPLSRACGAVRRPRGPRCGEIFGVRRVIVHLTAIDTLPLTLCQAGTIDTVRHYSADSSLQSCHCRTTAAHVTSSTWLHCPPYLSSLVMSSRLSTSPPLRPWHWAGLVLTKR